MRILLIEDNAMVSKMYEIAIRRMNIDVEVVADSFAFKDILPRMKEFNMVFCDYDFPGINGSDMVKEIRKMSNVYIIANSSDPSHNQKMLGDGANDTHDKFGSNVIDGIRETIEYAVNNGAA